MYSLSIVKFLIYIILHDVLTWYRHLASCLYFILPFAFDRSSEDDYCPPDQVDHIMFSVLEILQDLYLEVEVSTDYE